MVLLKAALRWLRNVPAAVRRAREDIDAVRQNDPAARSTVEVALLYPGLHALWVHRIAHDLWTHGAPLSARTISHVNRFVTGVEIHPGATIGRRVVIDHGMGVVIGETATVGDECLLYKGIVLGGTSLSRTKR
ncbi:MAG TPA: serine O-acetyltransferase, partial [Labilithrix sp.]